MGQNDVIRQIWGKLVTKSIFQRFEKIIPVVVQWDISCQNTAAIREKDRQWNECADLTAAFYHIDRSWLFKTIKQRLQNDMNCKLFDLLETLNNRISRSRA